MGTVVRRLHHLTQRTIPRQVFSPTRKYVFHTYILFIAYPVGAHPTGIEGANQTIFIRRIALRPPISFFGQPTFQFSGAFKPSALKRFRKTVASIKPDWWVVEEPGDTQSVPAIASGLVDIEDGSDDSEE
jgi:hypothetical protein